MEDSIYNSLSVKLEEEIKWYLTHIFAIDIVNSYTMLKTSSYGVLFYKIMTHSVI